MVNFRLILRSVAGLYRYFALSGSTLTRVEDFIRVGRIRLESALKLVPMTGLDQKLDKLHRLRLCCHMLYSKTLSIARQRYVGPSFTLLLLEKAGSGHFLLLTCPLLLYTYTRITQASCI